MAKKKKKYLIKLNNKIRNYFNGQPFDKGVATLDEDIIKIVQESAYLFEYITLSYKKIQP